MIERGDQGPPQVAAPHLQSQSGLASCGQDMVRVYVGGDLIAPTKPVKSGGGQDNGVVLAVGHVLNTSVQIAANFGEFEVLSQGAQLDLSPSAAGTDTRAIRKVVNTRKGCTCLARSAD